MRIISKRRRNSQSDCQHPRRPAFSWQRDASKQTDRRMAQATGIIRPSSSEYASPLVMENTLKIVTGSPSISEDYAKRSFSLLAYCRWALQLGRIQIINRATELKSCAVHAMP
ncbi:hypothetical protein TNCV_880931 [Trichonephila clavipes]|nr:hypothetical protein TNCV_880931 [Trichonephila clavipes]